MPATPQSLHQFVSYCQQHFRGDEKSELQSFLNKFFHARLDQLVMQAYGFAPSDDILEKLLTLNLELAEKEKNGEAIVGPWAP